MKSFSFRRFLRKAGRGVWSDVSPFDLARNALYLAIVFLQATGRLSDDAIFPALVIVLVVSWASEKLAMRQLLKPEGIRDEGEITVRLLALNEEVARATGRKWIWALAKRWYVESMFQKRIRFKTGPNSGRPENQAV